MKLKSLVILLVLSNVLYAQEVEVLALSVEGSVYVKKAGKRFAETIKLDTRYGEGSKIKTDQGSSVKLLLSDSSIATIPGDMSWVVGESLDSITTRSQNTGNSNLWNLTINMLDSVNDSASNSNIVGSIRVAGAEEDVKNAHLTEEERTSLNNALAPIEETQNFANSKMKGIIYTSYKQSINAEDSFKKALSLASNDKSYNQIIDYLVFMLQDIDRPKMADNYLKQKK